MLKKIKRRTTKWYTGISRRSKRRGIRTRMLPDPHDPRRTEFLHRNRWTQRWTSRDPGLGGVRSLIYSNFTGTGFLTNTRVRDISSPTGCIHTRVRVRVSDMIGWEWIR